jgi:hypothetical protein
MRMSPQFRRTAKLLMVSGWLICAAGRCMHLPFSCSSFTPVVAPADTSLCRQYNGALDYPALARERTITWEMNNILFSSSDNSLNKFKNLEESTMDAEVVLYDLALIQAEESMRAKADTTRNPPVYYETLCNEYWQRHHPEKYLRIKIRMRSQFSQKSLDPGLWTIYLVDENNDMYEPDSLKSGIVEEKKVERWENSQRYYRHHFTTEFNAYFPLVTFYHQPLMPANRKYLKLVLAYKQEVIGEGSWCFSTQGPAGTAHTGTTIQPKKE